MGDGAESESEVLRHRISFSSSVSFREFWVSFPPHNCTTRLKSTNDQPCALSDALAAYLYLIDPPPGAQHKAVDPSKLTIGGDSAGAGIALSLLCLIRDSNNLPMPAGAVLISPWVDLTHSFPSILTNTETDVIRACLLPFTSV